MSADWNEWYVPASEHGVERLQDRLKEAFRRSPRYVRLVANMVRDERVPVRAKGALILGGSYVVSPIDLIPGIIPVLGQIDDLIVIMAAIGAATRLCPPDLVEEHLASVQLTSLDITRDAETARLAGKWVVRRGWNAARSVAGHGARLTADVAQRGWTMLGEWRGSR